MNAAARRWSRREALGVGAAGLALPGCGARRPVSDNRIVTRSEFAELSVAALRQGLQAGSWTARALCEACLEAVAAVDQAGPALRSVIEINPDARAEADRLDAERRNGRTRGPLHGIPVMLKDNIGTADRMQTTAGSLALVGAGAPRDSGVAARLRAAGALLVAKTNLSEWANFRSRQSTSGWSARGGLTLNPYALDRNPCGSSSGSAVAVAAGLAPLAVGTETNGSIVCPASINGVVGVKPTVGLVSRSGIVPISHTQDTAGPMARTVADAAALLGALAGRDPLDAATEASPRPGGDYARYLNPRALRGARIGLLRNYWGRHAGIDSLLGEAERALRAAGAELIDLENLPGIESTNGPGFELMLYEFKAGLEAYLADLGPAAKVRTLEDVIRFNEKRGERELRYFGQDILEAAAVKGPLSEPAYLTALAQTTEVARRAVDGAIEARSLDALFAPTTGPAWVTDLERGDQPTFRGCSSPAARAGYPHVTVPGGFVEGLPVGVSFFGPAWSEPKLLGLAYAFEQETLHRRPPEPQAA